jgi:hypothetical protein
LRVDLVLWSESDAQVLAVMIRAGDRLEVFREAK